MGWKSGLNRKADKPLLTSSPIWRGVVIEHHDPREAQDYVCDKREMCKHCRVVTEHVVRRGEHVEIRTCQACKRDRHIWLADEQEQLPDDTKPKGDEPMAKNETVTVTEDPMTTRIRELAREEIAATEPRGGGHLGAGRARSDRRDVREGGRRPARGHDRAGRRPGACRVAVRADARMLEAGRPPRPMPQGLTA